MTDEHIKNTFSRLLKYYLLLNNKNPVDIVNDLNVPSSTVSNWVNGERMPRMGKIEMLANYFNIEKSDLLEEKKDRSNVDYLYYLDDESKEAAQFLFENSEYKVLFDATKNVKKEDIALVKELLERFSKDK